MAAHYSNPLEGVGGIHKVTQAILRGAHESRPI
jgi:hypothetical protein